MRVGQPNKLFILEYFICRYSIRVRGIKVWKEWHLVSCIQHLAPDPSKYSLLTWQVINAGAEQITPPFWDKVAKCWAFHVEFQREEFIVRWTGDWRRSPSLQDFPALDRAQVLPVTHTTEIHQCWIRSHFIAYGSDSQVRIYTDCTDGFPVCKVAVKETQRLLVRDEFWNLKRLSLMSLPVVRIHDDPLIDERGIFGFRMEKLISVDLEQLRRRPQAIAEAINEVHKTGLVHNDVSMSNLMCHNDGHIVLIDFGRAGHNGEKVPTYHPDWRHDMEVVFSTQCDILRVEKLLSAITPTFQAVHKLSLTITQKLSNIEGSDPP